MKYLLILLILFSTQVYSKSPDGKGLICTYGKNNDIYEAYLFFKKKYISLFLFLENNKFSIRQNEKRNYSVTNGYINLLPFKIHEKNLKVINTEFNRIIGSCELVNSHDKAMEFMHQIKKKYQNKIDKNIGILTV